MITKPRYRTIIVEYGKSGVAKRQTVYLGWGYMAATNAALEWANIADQGTRIVVEHNHKGVWHVIYERFASPSGA